MTFDETYERECAALMKAGQPFEISRDGGATWEHLLDPELDAALRREGFPWAAHFGKGIRLSDGSYVRFMITEART